MHGREPDAAAQHLSEEFSPLKGFHSFPFTDCWESSAEWREASASATRLLRCCVTIRPIAGHSYVATTHNRVRGRSSVNFSFVVLCFLFLQPQISAAEPALR